MQQHIDQQHSPGQSGQHGPVGHATPPTRAAHEAHVSGVTSATIGRARKPWTKAQVEILRCNYPFLPTHLVASMCGHSEKSTYQKASVLELAKSAEYLTSPESGRLHRNDNRGGHSRFKRGNVPHNKGLRRPGWAPGRMAATQFKKGDRLGAAQHNYVPIGSLRVSKDGYLERKVTDDPSFVPNRRWVSVHRLVWEAAHGPVPQGHAVVFLPGRRTADLAAITLDGLELVSRAELMRRNSYHTRYPKEVAQLIQLKGALNRKINRRSRQA